MMLVSFRKNPIYRIFLYLLIILILILLIYLIQADPERLAFGDTVQYWAAARLMLVGENPYSAEQVLELRHQAGNFTEFSSNAISMMLYPPWTFPFILPFGVLGYPTSRILWLFFHISVIVFSSRIIWRLYDGPPKLEWLAYLIAFTFEPVILLLRVGHISTLHYLGIAGFLFFIGSTRQNRSSDLAAGACVALVTIKPQLLYLFLIALLLWTVTRKRWWIIAGGGLLLAITSSISMIINPVVFKQYWEAVSNYPVGAWATPTLGSVLRVIFGMEKDWLQVLPAVLGVIWLLFYWWKRRGEWDWLKDTPHLILTSFIFTPYTWSYDMVVLLIPILQVFIRFLRNKLNWIAGFLLFFYFFMSLFATFLHIHVNDFWFIWLTPIILLWYLFGMKLSSNKSTSYSQIK